LKDEPKIVVSKDGPYLVSGGIPLSIQTIIPDERGFSWDWKQGKTLTKASKYKLCRCGHSKNKPFCDDTHMTIAFEGEENLSRGPSLGHAKRYDGQTLTLQDTEVLCAHARFCLAVGGIWKQVKTSDDLDARELAVREANHCPSGRLAVVDKGTQKEIEHDLTPSIGVVEDPVRGCSGPLWVRGGIRIEFEDGVPYEVRNRVTLCRCGVSSNKPFCNGSHMSIKFRDDLVEF
jgi:CDGSH-type Zn-finger protein